MSRATLFPCLIESCDNSNAIVIENLSNYLYENILTSIDAQKQKWWREDIASENVLRTIPNHLAHSLRDAISTCLFLLLTATTNCNANMPRMTPIHRQQAQYSRDLKRRVIYQSKILNMTNTQVAINLDMPVRVVEHVKQTWRDIGEVCRDRRMGKRGRPPLT
ncbi:hypothetical protein B0H34DRAFT_808019 [Crassisporium funariophilum]|nr:hypothetical protein B0H34DRAFT_808019 [Crassisporium funariophilum]